MYGADDELAEKKIRGLTASGALVDEITTLTESFWMMLLGRLSPKGAKLFGSTNTDSPYHWLKTKFLDRDDLDLVHWTFTLDDNPSLDTEYKANLKKEYTGVWFDRFVLGRWTVAEGAVYDFFRPELPYVVDTVPTAQSYYVGIDYGTANPCAFILLGVSGKKAWVEKEYYWDSKARGHQLTDSEYLREYETWIGATKPRAIYMDPSAASLKLEFAKRHIVYDGVNAVLPGIQLVSTMLKTGKLTIHKNCRNLCNELTGYAWDPNAQKRGEDKPLKQNDHGADALRYLTNSIFGAQVIDYAKFNQM